MSSNERVHTDSRQKADLLYRRPANQNESHSSMTNKVHDASSVSWFKEVGDLSLIWVCTVNNARLRNFENDSPFPQWLLASKKQTKH